MPRIWPLPDLARHPRAKPPSWHSAPRRSLVVTNSGGDKVNLKEVGLNSVENDTVRNNLMGKSRYMNKKGWVDSQGRKVGGGAARAAGQASCAQHA